MKDVVSLFPGDVEALLNLVDFIENVIIKLLVELVLDILGQIVVEELVLVLVPHGRHLRETLCKVLLRVCEELRRLRHLLVHVGDLSLVLNTHVTKLVDIVYLPDLPKLLGLHHEPIVVQVHADHICLRMKIVGRLWNVPLLVWSAWLWLLLLLMLAWLLIALLLGLRVLVLHIEGVRNVDHCRVSRPCNR